MPRYKELLIFITLICTAGLAAAQDFSTKNWPMWLVTSADGLRSPPPPADAAEELRQLKDLASHRTAADMDRITWWDVGGPVYRWNQIASDELLDHGVNTLMAARHLALLHAAMQDATVIAWDSKRAYGRPRPSELELDARGGPASIVKSLLSLGLRRRHDCGGRSACLCVSRSRRCSSRQGRGSDALATAGWPRVCERRRRRP